MKQIFQCTLLLLLWSAVSVHAQTDVRQTIKELPEQDGTYLLTVEEGISFYAVKKQGKIVEYLATDADGQVIPATDSAPVTISKERSSAAKKKGRKPPVTLPICASPPGQLCRWSSFSNSCICIITILI